MTSPNVRTFTDASFAAEVLASPLPVLVDFTAPWCCPCKVLAPIVEQLADDLAGKLRVYMLDIVDTPETAKQYGVRTVPTYIVFRDGARVSAQVGQTTRASLRKQLGL